MNITRSIRKRWNPIAAHCRQTVRRIFAPTYDDQLVAVMRRILRRDSCCIDVGAHCGDILKEMLRLAPDGQHHAFEAIPHLADSLRRDFPRATIHAVAVADRTGVAEFQHVENDPAYSGLKPRLYDRPDPKIVKITVPVTTLDEVLPGIQPALIKLDIEGGEYHALCGADQLLRRHRPHIAFEASDRSTGQYGVTADMLFDLLATRGYGLFTMHRWLRSQPPLTREVFSRNWTTGPDYFWFAAPRTL